MYANQLIEDLAETVGQRARVVASGRGIWHVELANGIRFDLRYAGSTSCMLYYVTYNQQDYSISYPAQRDLFIEDLKADCQALEEVAYYG